MVGANPLVSHGSVLSAPRIREQLNEIVERGGRVVVVDPRRTETARQFEHLPIRPDADAWLLLSMLERDLRRGARGRALPSPAARAAPSELAAARGGTSRPSAPRSVTGLPARHGPRDRARVRGRAERGRLRAHRLLPGPVRHARRLPARRAQRRDREPRRPGGAVFGRPPIALDDVGEKSGLDDLRQDPLADRRLPGRDRQPAGHAAAEGDHDAGQGPDPRVLRLGRQPGPVGARTGRARARRSSSST